MPDLISLFSFIVTFKGSKLSVFMGSLTEWPVSSGLLNSHAHKHLEEVLDGTDVLG